jgi:hypothetical protein
MSSILLSTTCFSSLLMKPSGKSDSNQYALMPSQCLSSFDCSWVLRTLLASLDDSSFLLRSRTKLSHQIRRLLEECRVNYWFFQFSAGDRFPIVKPHGVEMQRSSHFCCRQSTGTVQ